MRTYEAKSRAYFIAALLVESIAEHMPEVFSAAAEQLEVPQAELEQIRLAMQGHVAGHLRLQGARYRAMVMLPPRKQGRKP